MLSKDEIKNRLSRWYRAWNHHDLDEVMTLFHEEILFENWTGGRAKGKGNLLRAWVSWFENHGDFRFSEEETFIDVDAQKALYRWQLDWPSFEKGHEGKHEMRRGVDILHFQDGKIIQKLTYSKTTIEIEGRRKRLTAR